MCTLIRAGFTFWAASLFLATTRADDDPNVTKAIERGVAFLKNHPDAEGRWSFGREGHAVGVSSLVGLALLECNVPASDRVIQSAAQAVRHNVMSVDDTYDISLAVMFLDRLGMAGDNGLIETCCLRLFAGQSAAGGWGYSCPRLSGETERHLRTLLAKKGSRKSDAVAAIPEKQRPGRAADPGHAPPHRWGDDNSNTQFATLALWIARRHELKTDAALASVEGRFRRSQNGDGGWGYVAGGGSGEPGGFLGSTGSMTCAGLLGLAVGYGVSTETVLHTGSAHNQESPATKKTGRDDPNRQRAIERGLGFIASMIEQALGDKSSDEAPDEQTEERDRFRRRPGGRGGPWQRGNIVHNGLGSIYYFLWSLERVAMVYGLDTIGNKDWFALGSKYIVAAQQEDGAWRGGCGEVVDTCFALFYLRRANLAGDLTATLRGRVRDPGIVNLKAQSRRRESAKAKTDIRSDKETAKVAPVEQPKRATKAVPTRRPQLDSKSDIANSEAGSEPSAAFRDRDAGWLRERIMKAPPEERPVLLERLREGKGHAYTEALATAIPHLSEAAKSQARDALAERLARMTLPTLQEKLRDPDSEIRRSAALACAMKDEKSSIPALIALLDDAEPKVVRAAHAALKGLTNQDFGPARNANPDERKRVMANWRQWWEKNEQGR